MHCLICNSSDLTQVSVLKINRTAYECNACTFVFLWPQPTSQEIDDIYKESYYKSWGVHTGEEKQEIAILKKETADHYIQKVMKHQQGRTLLDIGAAFGYCMEVAEKRGFDVHGVELSDFSSAIAQKRFGSKLVKGKLEDANYADGTFDVVTMFDLIEHIPQPVPFMKEVRRVIKSGGHIGITTPDTSSFSAKLLGYSGWFHWKYEHLAYFNEKSIEELAKLTGFSLVEKKRSYKSMSFQYLYDQFSIFPSPIFSPIMKVLSKILPERLKHKTFFISGGEMFVVLKAE